MDGLLLEYALTLSTAVLGPTAFIAAAKIRFNAAFTDVENASTEYRHHNSGCV